MTRLLAAMVLLAPAGFVACHTSVFHPLTSADSGTQIDLRAGEKLELQLSANATTGYEWQVIHGADAVLDPMGEMAYVRDPSAAGRPGAGGTAIWHFRAARAGSDALRLEYRRSWETGVPAARTFSCTIRVR